MVAVLFARVAVAAPASIPLLPDLNAKLHPSDSTPWTILLVLTLITLLPAILMCHDAAGAAAGGLSLPAPGAGHADCAVESHADGPGADDDLVSDDAGAQSGGPAGRRAVSRRADHRHGSHRPGSAAGEAVSVASTRARKILPCSPPPARFRGPTRPTICPCAWWFRPTSSPS